MISTILLFVISIFWAMNMGASGLAVSFAPSVGSNVIKRNKAVWYFTAFVLIGALSVGSRVAKTLSSKIIPSHFLTQEVVLVVLFSACFAIFIATLLRIPQSTSIITVGAFVGAGLYFRALNYRLIFYLLLVWVGVSLLSYFITYGIIKLIYPPRQKNLKSYEKFLMHADKLKKFTLWTDYYSAFGIGTNNVANVVGPLLAARLILPTPGFILFSFVFGIGAFLLGRRVLSTVSKEIVPLGTISASIISLVVSSFIIGCSLLGLPAPYVQFSSLSILAVHTAKEEKNHVDTLDHPITKKILKVWLFTPLVSVLLCYFLLLLLGAKR